MGKSPTNDATRVYAKREGWNTVVMAAREPLSPWRGAANDFRDSRLFELTAPVAEIEVRGTNHFILRQRGSNDWQIVGEKYPADADTIQLFISRLAGLRIADLVKDAVTASNLLDCGLVEPQREIILRSKAGDTNAVIADLQFGAVQTNGIFVQRPDENFIYAVAVRDFTRLQDESREFRDRRIWDFKVDDVAQITIHQGENTRRIVHNGPGKWSLVIGSQGLIEGRYIEQTAQMFHDLAADVWAPRDIKGPDYGFSTNSLQITFELKNGEKNTVDFGTAIKSAQGETALAAVTLDGERWAFLFPPALYQLVLSYFTIPTPQGGMP